ncbi:Coiled-coil domain-containing protein SCD2 [Linum perenne]
MVKSILDSSAGNINRTTAAKNCIEALADSMYQTQSTVAAVEALRIKDARAWMSAALLYQYDCSNAINRYGRQRTPAAPSSPVASPIHPQHARTGSTVVKKAHTKAAAQRLAHVMSHQRPDNDDNDEDDEPIFAGGGLGSIGLAGGRKIQPRSPMRRPVVQNRVHVKASAEDNSDNDDDRAPISGTTRTATQSRVPVKLPQPVEEDSDKDDDSVVVSGPVSIGLAGGRSVRPQSPMMKSGSQIRAPVKTYQPPSDRDSDKDDDHSPVSGTVSIGRGGGRSMQARPSMVRPVAQNQVPIKTATSVDEDSDKDDSYSPISGRLSIGQAGGRTMRGQSPMAVRTRQDQLNSLKSGRLSSSVSSGEQLASLSSASSAPAVQINNAIEQAPSARATIVGRSSSNTAEQPLSARSPSAVRTSINSSEQPPSARSTAGRLGPSGIRKMPSSVPISLRPVSSMMSLDTTSDNWKDQRLGMDVGSTKLNEANSRPASALQDEIDMLQEENESIVDKLRLAEERQEEAEARVRQLEQQVANLGEGVSLDARLINRLVMSAKEEAAAAFDQLQEAALEVKSFRNMTQRMVLTQEEMEEVVLKRCWLARYWNLCVEHGIHAEIAKARYGYWSSFAPLPFEVVLAAGQRAQAEEEFIGNDSKEREKVLQGTKELSGEGNIESMLLVERGLREMATLKVEDALALALAQKRLPNSQKPGGEDVKLPSEGENDAFELSQEEAEDVLFRQAWLAYFWRRARDHGVEEDVAEERLEFWINHSAHSSSSLDAVDVERGIQELRKLGLENQLWHESRRGLEFGSSSKAHMEAKF